MSWDYFSSFGKLILQTRMRSHPVGLDIWFLVGPFVYFHTLCVRTVKALVRLCRLAWAFAGRLCDKYHNLMMMSWLKSLYKNMYSTHTQIALHAISSTHSDPGGVSQA